MEHILAGVLQTWSFTLVENPDGQVTIGKVVIAIILAIFGYIFSKKSSHKFAQAIAGQFKLPLSTKATIKTIFFYLTYTIVLFFVLKLLEVPLTIFTVLGGAVAIGVGFGSQNIIRNFLSGITVLVEQPIRVGDFVEVEGIHGEVESIGFRSTRVRTGENTHIVIPNSSFLEQKVLNWTLSDDIIRGQVKVGVAYGSDLDQVKEVLSNLEDKAEFILKNPAPYCLFCDFGDSSLDFEYFFFCRANSRTRLRKKQSDVRFLIDQEFRKHNITIAFPQLDLHIQNQKEEGEAQDLSL